MASASTSRPRAFRKPLASKTIQAANTNYLAQRQDAEDRWIKVPISRTPDKENLHVGIRRSARKYSQTTKSVIESPFVLAKNRFANHTLITILLPAGKGKEKVGASVEPEEVESVVKNVEDASLAVESKLIPDQSEELGAIWRRKDRICAEEFKTEELMAARDQWMKKMEEELASRGKAQEELEIEFRRLLRLLELRNHRVIEPSIRKRRVACGKGSVDEEERGRTHGQGESSRGVGNRVRGVAKTH